MNGAKNCEYHGSHRSPSAAEGTRTRIAAKAPQSARTWVMSSAARGSLRFVFYGRTTTPVPAKSPEAMGEQERQLAIAQALVGDSGSIAISYFDTRSHRFSTWRHRPKARRILTALSNPNRGFDAIVVGDTRAVMSVQEFDGLTYRCLLHNVQLWCPENRRKIRSSTIKPSRNHAPMPLEVHKGYSGS